MKIKDAPQDVRDIEMMRTVLLSVSPHYPGFENEAMKRNINRLCDLALLGVDNEPKTKKKPIHKSGSSRRV